MVAVGVVDRALIATLIHGKGKRGRIEVEPRWKVKELDGITRIGIEHECLESESILAVRRLTKVG